jgi:hypothetical protein
MIPSLSLIRKLARTVEQCRSFGRCCWTNSLSRVRVHVGVTVNRGQSTGRVCNGHNEINQIACIPENAIWLSSLDTFRTFAAQLIL